MRRMNEKPIKKNRRRRRIVRRIVTLVIVLALLAGVGWYGYGMLKQEYSVTYDGYTATIGSISNSLSFSGSLQLIDSASYTASSSGTVRTKAVRCEKEIAQSDLETVLSTLNTWLVGRAVESINLPLMVELENAMGTLSWLVSPLCKIVYDAMAEQRESDLRVEGVNRLLQYPEYENIDELRNMISLFEDKQDLLTVIAGEGEGECGDADGVRVVIGSESAVKVMNNSALIYRPVKRNGEVIGAIGVVGPRRMDYAKVISTIDQLAERLDTLLGGTQPPALPAQPAAKDNSERNDS